MVVKMDKTSAVFVETMLGDPIDGSVVNGTGMDKIAATDKGHKNKNYLKESDIYSEKSRNSSENTLSTATTSCIKSASILSSNHLHIKNSAKDKHNVNFKMTSADNGSVESGDESKSGDSENQNYISNSTNNHVSSDNIIYNQRSNPEIPSDSCESHKSFTQNQILLVNAPFPDDQNSVFKTESVPNQQEPSGNLSSDSLFRETNSFFETGADLTENYLLNIKKRCRKKVGRRDKHLLKNCVRLNGNCEAKTESSIFKSVNKGENSSHLLVSTSEMQEEVLKEYLTFLYGDDAAALETNETQLDSSYIAVEESNSSSSTFESYKVKSMKNKFDYRKECAESKPYICGICSKSFGQHSNIVLHMRSHTGEKPYVCDICGKGFSGKSDLNRHKNIHSAVKKYWCQECERGFNDNSGFRRHKLIYHSASSHKCHICPKSYLALKDLERHLKTHLRKEREKKLALLQETAEHILTESSPISSNVTDDNNYSLCEDSNLTESSVSSETFTLPDSNKSSANMEAMAPDNPYSQSADRPHKCNECEFSCSKRSNLRKHVAYVHCLERFYKCDVCFKGFKSSWALKRHKQVHSLEKSYQCDLCQKGFNDTGSLKYHMKIHRGEKPHQCDICAKSFILKSDLKKHMSTHLKKFQQAAEQRDIDDTDMEVLIQADNSFLNLASYVQSSGR